MEELRDLEDVTVDASLPVEERVRSFAEQIGDPYHFTTHGVEVRLSFAGQIPIEGAVARILGIDDAPLPLPKADGGAAGASAGSVARGSKSGPYRDLIGKGPHRPVRKGRKTA